MEDMFTLFDEYLQSKDLNIVRGLTIAIELEVKSRNYYLSKFNEMENLNGKTLLRFLADEELAHLRILERVKRNLEANKKWIDLKKIDAKEMGKPRLFEGMLTEPIIKVTSSDEDLLLAAMSAERKSEEYYARMAGKVSDEKGKGFFQTLAKFERRHYELIRALLKP